MCIGTSADIKPLLKVAIAIGGEVFLLLRSLYLQRSTTPIVYVTNFCVKESADAIRTNKIVMNRWPESIKLISNGQISDDNIPYEPYKRNRCIFCFILLMDGPPYHYILT